MSFIAGTTTQAAAQNHLATVYYNRVGLDTLVPKFRMYQAAEKFTLPNGNGKTMQMWRDNVPAYNTTPSSEGVPLETPFVNGTSTLTVSVEQYSDMMATSKLMEDTSITNEAERLIRALSIRAAGSVDTIVRLEVDSNVGVTGCGVDVLDGSTHHLAVADFKIQGSLMEGANVAPFDGSRWLAVIHPYLKYDLMADNTAGGFIDSLKYSSGNKVLQGEVGEVASTRILLSSNVGDDGVAATSTKYYCYMFGYQGLGVVDLAGSGPDPVEDPKQQNFKINVAKGGGAWDITNEIGTVAGYRFVFAAKTLDNKRFRIIKADSSIV